MSELLSSPPTLPDHCRLLRWIGSAVAALAAVEFFLYEVPKVLLLLTAVVFVVGVVRTFVTPERARLALAERMAAMGLMATPAIATDGNLVLSSHPESRGGTAVPRRVVKS